MKKIICIVLTLFASLQSKDLYEPSWDQISVGIMGGSSNSLTLMNNNNFYGLDILTFSGDISIENTAITISNNGNTSSTSLISETEASFSAYIFMPRLGKRFNLRSVNRLHSYYKGEISLILPFVSIETDGRSNTTLENDIKDIVDMLGFKLAYGIEYKFNDQLSFSTDFGFNYLWNNIDIAGSDLSARLGHTYTLLSLNYSLE